MRPSSRRRKTHTITLTLLKASVFAFFFVLFFAIHSGRTGEARPACSADEVLHRSGREEALKQFPSAVSGPAAACKCQGGAPCPG